MTLQAANLAGMAAEALVASSSPASSRRSSHSSAVVSGSVRSPSTDEDDTDEMDESALPEIPKPARGLHQEGLPGSERTSSSEDESDHSDDNISNYEEDEDDIYNAVDFISDSDGEGSDLEDQETANILHDFEGDAIHNLGEFNLHHDGSLFPGDMPYFADQMRRIVYSNLAEDLEEEESMKSPVFGTFPTAPSAPPPTPTRAFRRVRFDAVDDSLKDDELTLQAWAAFESAGETTDEDEVPLNATKSPRALLRHATWDIDLPESPPPTRASRHGRTCSRKKPCAPRVATWNVHPGKALAQSDENHKVVIMTPVNPEAEVTAVCENQARLPPSDLITGLLQKDGTESIAISSKAGSVVTAEPSIVVSEAIKGPEILDPFCPATELIHDLAFAAANSDHESTDLDIMDYITFSSDSDDDGHDTDDQSDAGLRPLPTPDPSTTQTTPCGTEIAFQSSLMDSLRHDMVKSKSPVHMRKPHNGLALSRPRVGMRSSITPPKFDRKRKASDAHLSGNKRPNMRRASTQHR